MCVCVLHNVLLMYNYMHMCVTHKYIGFHVYTHTHPTAECNIIPSLFQLFIGRQQQCCVASVKCDWLHHLSIDLILCA